ncbi:MAG: hypothetical protein DCC65_03040 [Planctomycetota bacterium]|nr:MAG: hypothetical protein DCC65_03040 [Planctomycetota bacterium]
MEPAATVIVFVGLLGAAVGSFLNVVIYRLPRGMGVHEPRRSFCPACGVTIKGYHNIPLLSWLWLGGRCHNCGIPISCRYPLVEAATALVFMSVWDQLFVVRSVPQASQLATDWMLALGYFTLFGCLLASAAMDIDSYTIDIRLCILAMVIGVTVHAAHGLPHARPSAGSHLGDLPPSIVMIGAAMGLTWAATFFIGRAIRPSILAEPPPDGEPGTDTNTADAGTPPRESDSPPEKPLSRAPILLFIAVLVGLALWQVLAPHKPTLWLIPAGALRAILAASILMFLLIMSAWAPRDVDDAVYSEIEETRPHARRTALHELAWLAPALIVGVVAFALLRRGNGLNATWSEAVNAAGVPVWLASRLIPATAAIAAMVWAAAIGWTVRILGTLAFGKEAYGTGDIYLMAAIGATAGLWNCFFGFFVASILALIGVLATLIRGARRAIPFGPWLALGSFCVLAMERKLLLFFQDAGAMLWTLLTGIPR